MRKRGAAASEPSLTILFIGQDEARLRAFRAFAHSEGIDAEISGGKYDSLRIAKAVRPRVVVMDVGVMASDGLEIVRALRDSPQTRGIPILIARDVSRELLPLVRALAVDGTPPKIGVGETWH